jgi:hypothetical protein
MKQKRLRMIPRLATLLKLKVLREMGMDLRAYEYFKKQEKWALDVACEISVSVATEILKNY